MRRDDKKTSILDRGEMVDVDRVPQAQPLLSATRLPSVASRASEARKNSTKQKNPHDGSISLQAALLP
jgi:hypothetical protein